MLENVVLYAAKGAGGYRFFDQYSDIFFDQIKEDQEDQRNTKNWHAYEDSTAGETAKKILYDALTAGGVDPADAGETAADLIHMFNYWQEEFPLPWITDQTAMTPLSLTKSGENLIKMLIYRYFNYNK